MSLYSLRLNAHQFVYVGCNSLYVVMCVAVYDILLIYAELPMTGRQQIY